MTARNDTVRNLPALAAGSTAQCKGGSTHLDAGFAAQLLCSGGHRRGLKGGAPVLAQARSAYLRTEWAGRADRRPPAGGLRAERI